MFRCLQSSNLDKHFKLKDRKLEKDQHGKPQKHRSKSEQTEYLKKHFELNATSEDEDNPNFKLAKMTTIGQFLVGDDKVIEEEYVTNNLVDDIDGLEELQGQNYHSKFWGTCPNLYDGADDNSYSEKFLTKKSVKISIDPNDTNPLTITHKDLKNFTNSERGGAFGSVYFLKDMAFENDHLSEDGYKSLKEKIVVKVQERDMKKGTTRRLSEMVLENGEIAKVIGEGATCFAFNELVELQKKRLWKENDPWRKHSDLYITHFYAISEKDPSKCMLYLVLKKCDLILSNLIIKFHGKNCRNRNFIAGKKFPIILLKNIIDLFYSEDCCVHNDLKPDNIGYQLVKKKKKGGFFSFKKQKSGFFYKTKLIDFGSMNGSSSMEPTNAKFSIFPGTALYLSFNKVPFSDSGEIIIEDDDDNMMEMPEEMDEIQTLKIVTATSKMALPNYDYGYGDNMWAIAMVILECIFGFPLSILFGLNYDEIFRCIRQMNFYQYFKDSKIYREFYQSDDEFLVVDEFLRGALVQDPKVRDRKWEEQKWKYMKQEFKVDQESLDSIISKFM